VLKRIFDPKSIALIGATEKEGSVGRALLENLLASGSRRVFAVNPNREQALGERCFPSVSSLLEPVDLAVVATPASSVPAVVEECGRFGVRGAMILSAGFKETGVDGTRLEQQIQNLRRIYPIRIIGPNCLGMIRPTIGLNASFLKVTPEKGNIALVSQSGALGSALLDWAVSAHIGFSMFASLGSMIDIDFGDLIDFLGRDPYTRSIMLYMEGVGNARKLMSAARGFARNKPIIVVKPGKYAESARAALSHTGAMAGDDQVYRAAFRRAGMVRVNQVSDLFNASEVLQSKRLPQGMQMAIVTNAGGVGVIATDALIEMGGRLAEFSEKSMAQLNAVMPPHWSRGNPVDVLGDCSVEHYRQAVEVCLSDGGVSGILVIYTPQGAANSEELAKAIVEIARESHKPLIAVWMGGERARVGREIFLRNSIPAYDTPEDAVQTYLHMAKYARNLELLYETPEELPVDQAPPKHHLKAFIRRLVREGRTVLNEEESKRFLSNYGIPVTRIHDAADVEGALAAARETGYPVVLKIVSPDITHKSDAGGVAAAICSDEALRREYDALLRRVQGTTPGARIAGVSVQRMVERIDYELILGAKKDQDFGSVILFGLGGIGTELFHDFAVGLPPLNQTLARRLMEETRVYRMLQGFRGRPPADLRELERILMRFSNLVVDFPEIAEMDINPLAVARGEAWALDARIVIDEASLDAESPYPHLVITPYPSRYVMPWKLSDGREVLLRPIRPEDEPLERDMLSTLSEESLRGRFFQVIRNIPHEMLTRFCNIDYDREMAIVAEIREEEMRRFIGIGRLIIDPDFRNSEFAVVVHDDYQGTGLGYKLIDALIGIAQERGLEHIHGDVLSDNKRMLRVCEKLGFTAERGPDGISRLTLQLK
jgi:acetyltransferase